MPLSVGETNVSQKPSYRADHKFRAVKSAMFAKDSLLLAKRKSGSNYSTTKSNSPSSDDDKQLSQTVRLSVLVAK